MNTPTRIYKISVIKSKTCFVVGAFTQTCYIWVLSNQHEVVQYLRYDIGIYRYKFLVIVQPWEEKEIWMRFIYFKNSQLSHLLGLGFKNTVINNLSRKKIVPEITIISFIFWGARFVYIYFFYISVHRRQNLQ